jgi:hypothetical protein
MSYTIYEYNRLSGDGEPMEPPLKITYAQATGVAVNLANGTNRVSIIPQAAMHIVFGSNNAVVATANDAPLAANTINRFACKAGSNNWIYGV